MFGEYWLAFLVVAFLYPLSAPAFRVHFADSRAAIGPFTLERKFPNIPKYIFESNLASAIENPLFLFQADGIEGTNRPNDGGRAYQATSTGDSFQWRNNVGQDHFVSPKIKWEFLWLADRCDHPFLENCGFRLPVKRYAPINTLQEEELDGWIKLKIIKRDFQPRPFFVFNHLNLGVSGLGTFLGGSSGSQSDFIIPAHQVSLPAHVPRLSMYFSPRSVQDFFLAFQKTDLQNQRNSLQNIHYHESKSEYHESECVPGDFFGSLILVTICAAGLLAWSFYLYYNRRWVRGTLVFALASVGWLCFDSAITFNDPLFLARWVARSDRGRRRRKMRV